MQIEGKKNVFRAIEETVCEGTFDCQYIFLWSFMEMRFSCYTAPVKFEYIRWQSLNYLQFI